MRKFEKEIVFAGGGVSGGHSASIVAIIHELKQRPDFDASQYAWIGSEQGRERTHAQQEGIVFFSVSTGKLRRYWSFENAKDAVRTPLGIRQSYKLLKKLNPRVVFASGGYVSVPTAIAASLLKTPVVIHENDVMPGLANRILARVASKILVSAEETKLYFVKKYQGKKQVIHTGIPIRTDVLGGDKRRGYDHFLFKANRPTLLVIGGAQGARTLNNVIVNALPELEKYCQIIHVCGEANIEEVKNKIEALHPQDDEPHDHPHYCLMGYAGMDLRDAYAIADIALTRGSAHVLNELSCYGVPSIIVPIGQYSSGHQRVNADHYEKAGASIVIPEEDFSQESFMNVLLPLLKDNEKRLNMSVCAQHVFKSDATQAIVRELESSKKSQ